MDIGVLIFPQPNFSTDNIFVRTEKVVSFLNGSGGVMGHKVVLQKIDTTSTIDFEEVVTKYEVLVHNLYDSMCITTLWRTRR